MIKALILFVLWLSSEEYDVLISVDQTVEVEASTAKLNDIAKITPVKNLDLALALGKVEVVNKLQPGATTSLKAGDVLKKISDEGFNIKSIGYTLPSEIRIKRRGQLVDKTLIEKAFNEYTNAQNLNCTITDILSNQPFVPTGPFDLNVKELDQSKYPPELILLVKERDRSNEQEYYYEIELPVKIKHFKEAAVLNSDLQEGALIQPSDIKKTKIEVETASSIYLSANECIGRVAATNLKAGAFCSSTNTKKRILARKKEPIEVVFRSGSLEIKMLGIAQNDGGEGDIISVRNPVSNRLLFVKLDTDGTGLVQ